MTFEWKSWPELQARLLVAAVLALLAGAMAP